METDTRTVRGVFVPDDYRKPASIMDMTTHLAYAPPPIRVYSHKDGPGLFVVLRGRVSARTAP